MTKLTNHIRESLLKKLLTRAFNARVNDLLDRRKAFAVKVYEDALGKDLKLVKSLPDGWLPTDDDFKVQIAGQVQGLYFSGSIGGCGLSSEFYACGVSADRIFKPFPNNKKQQVLKVFENNHPFSVEFTALVNETTDLKDEISKASRTAQAALDSVTTVKKLIEVWPEVEVFAKPYLEHGDRQAILPAIPRAALNTALNLPPQQEAA